MTKLEEMDDKVGKGMDDEVGKDGCQSWERRMTNYRIPGMREQ